MQMKKGTLWIGIDVAKETFEAAVDYPVIFENQSGKSYSELETKSFKKLGMHLTEATTRCSL